MQRRSGRLQFDPIINLGMFIFLLIGLLLTIIGITYKDTPILAVPSQMFITIGTTIIAATFIGFTIELGVRQRIVEDVFKATVGYLLPDELKGEMQWIYEQAIICTEHRQTFTLTPIPGTDLVRMRSQATRVFKNISDTRRPIQPFVDLHGMVS